MALSLPSPCDPKDALTHYEDTKFEVLTRPAYSILKVQLEPGATVAVEGFIKVKTRYRGILRAIVSQ